MKIVRGIIKVCIALFVVWHVTAVGIYSLYHVDDQPVLHWLDSKRTYFRPYILATSQWQRWNLFSPDPLRRVIEMTIKQWNGHDWETIGVLNQHTVSFWQRAPELKIMRRMEEENMQKLQERYVQDFCIRKGITPNTPLQLSKQWFVIPRHDVPESKDWWNNWQPEWNDVVLLETTCPASLQ